jgi:alpha-N-acetylglucosaminidase
MAVGLNWYLKYFAHASVSMNGRQTRLPDPLPELSGTVRREAWASARYFFNYCTFGYSMPWWDWAQWESCIDWMALNGINQPLAVTGQEGIWQAVSRRFGMTDTEIDAFLAGPPYLPFQWMGCLDGHGGPLPRDWIPRHVELGRKILARERELGMTPVLQGFTGHVPEALLKKFPDATAQRIHWIEWNTWMLDPTDPLFQRVGAAFLEEQTNLFGTDHLYAADSFIEMTPPSGDLDYLSKLGRAIYDGMAMTDPQAVWLLQGWTFMNQGHFWKQDRIQAFLDAVPDEGLQVLDLFCENRPVWNTTQGFHGKPWVWNFVYNFGNNTLISGSGPLVRFNDLAAARRDPLGRNLRGVGLMMEGFSHNPLLYDLMFELAWREDVDLAAWVNDFTRFRYGQPNADAQAAWKALRTSAYTINRNTQSKASLTSFPAVGRIGTRHPEAALAKAWRCLLQASPELGGLETFRHDLVNVARQMLSSRSGDSCGRAMSAAEAGDAAGHRRAAAEFLELIRDLDELLATSDRFLLGRWLEDAKRWGATDGERAKMEWNARRVLTLWGQGTRLRDYAWKEWSGLLTGFYAKRWEIFFRRRQEALDAGTPFDQASCHREILQFENDWAAARDTYPAAAKGDSVAVARRLYEKYAPQPVRHLALDKSVTCSFSLPGMEPALANDGIVDTESYWGTDVTKDPVAWWQVDMETPTDVGRVVVVAYYGDARHYGFTVEGSLDGQNWDLLADRRGDAAPSTKDGYTCRFSPRPLRYLRVTQTANSANTGRHLVEVMVFGE